MLVSCGAIKSMHDEHGLFVRPEIRKCWRLSHIHISSIGNFSAITTTYQCVCERKIKNASNRFRNTKNKLIKHNYEKKIFQVEKKNKKLQNENISTTKLRKLRNEWVRERERLELMKINNWIRDEHSNCWKWEWKGKRSEKKEWKKWGRIKEC